MTNHWADMRNSTLFFIMGANPAENHPASWAHMNYARETRRAKVVCVDPRKTRSAMQADYYVRIRPGTDIAFVNGLIKYITDEMKTGGAFESYMPKFKAFLNEKSAAAARVCIADDGNLVAMNTHPSGYPRYTDARFVVEDASGSSYYHKDYAVENVTLGGKAVSNFPKIVGDIEAAGHYTVYKALKAHVAQYDLTTVAAICGCTDQQIKDVAAYLVQNSRCAQSGDISDLDAWCRKNPDDGTGAVNLDYRVYCHLYAMGGTQHTYGSQNIRAYAVLSSMLGNMGRAGGGINALRGIHNVQGSTDMGLLYQNIIGYSDNPARTASKAGTFGYDASGMQTFAGYMDPLFGVRLGDNGLAAGDVEPSGGTYPGAKNAYIRSNGGLQQRGFFNMTQHWFGDPRFDPTKVTKAQMDSWYGCWPKGNGYQHIEAFQKMKDGTIKACYILGQNPAVTEPNQKAVREGLYKLDTLVIQEYYGTETVQCSRKPTGWTYLLPACSYIEEGGSVTNSGRWLQWRERCRAPKGNSKADLEWVLRLAKSLDTYGGFNHIPLTKWQFDASGNPVLDASGNPIEVAPYGNRYEKLWSYYGWTPGVGNFEDLTGTVYDDSTDASGNLMFAGSGRPLKGSEVVAVNVYKEMCSPYDGYVAGGASGVPIASPARSDYPLVNGGTLWIYSGNGKDATKAIGGYCETLIDANSTPWNNWHCYVRAMNRDGTRGRAWTYNRWGWAWLNNRRVFYNNGEVPGDVGDLFVRPGNVAALFCAKHRKSVVNWAGNLMYRYYSYLYDYPSVDDDTLHIHAHNFPCFTEPYETPYGTAAEAPLWGGMERWGHNTKYDYDASTFTPWNLVPTTTPVAGRGTGIDPDRSKYPLILTTIRCVEHFQGGPITRNNTWNVEAEPIPWIEISKADADARGITDGAFVNVITPRSNSTGQEEARTKSVGSSIAPADGWARGFIARVGTGLQSNQRVGQGVVAIPWHWGERGVGIGSRANDLCIDSWDANTTIPEYKACLCQVTLDTSKTPADL